VLTPTSEELSEAVASARARCASWAAARGPSDGRCGRGAVGGRADGGRALRARRADHRGEGGDAAGRGRGDPGRENQRLPFEPMDHRALLGTDGEPTIGGVVAANVSGPRRIQAGACRDSLIGVRFVDGTGTVLKNGGRVMKNVTGYDLVKLLAGSAGHAGRSDRGCLQGAAGHGDAGQRGDRGAEPAPGGGSDVDGAGIALRGDGGSASAGGETPRTLLRLEGFAASVAYRTERLSALLGTLRAVRAETMPTPFGRSGAVRDVEAFAGAPVMSGASR
jgi:glycolate oxidase FAD binding subunit